MTSLIPRPRSLFTDPFELLEHWPFASNEHAIRIEESVTGDAYVVRAELPGFDPDKDIHVTADGGVLHISAERKSSDKHNGHSEFYYGSFSRSRTLPAGADPAKITASYDNGILEVKAPYTAKADATEVKVKVNKA